MWSSELKELSCEPNCGRVGQKAADLFSRSRGAEVKYSHDAGTAVMS